ncbi:MAG: FtsQ-type POTRA domain-containing protein [Chloroflexi bacterium]|nr:FtsQ-type POTRA domain-containing protein [Chloroflexota bacterium]
MTLAVVPLWPVSEVSTEGTRQLGSQNAILVSGLVGTPTFRASGQDARGRLRALPAVRDATVELSLPGGARILVSEREPVARWSVSSGELLVDREGVLFASIDAAGGPATRIIDDRGTAKQGDRVDPALVSVASRLAALPARDLRPDEIAPTVHIAKDGTLILNSGAGWEVRFGGPEAFDEKMSAMRAFFREHPSGSLEYVDVARPGSIVSKP